MSFPGTELLLFNYAKVNSILNSRAPLTKILVEQTGKGQSPTTGINRAKQRCNHKPGSRSGQVANSINVIQADRSQ